MCIISSMVVRAPNPHVVQGSMVVFFASPSQWLNRIYWCFSTVIRNSIKRFYNILVSQLESHRLNFRSCYLSYSPAEKNSEAVEGEGAISRGNIHGPTTEGRGGSLPSPYTQLCCRNDCSYIFSWLDEFSGPFIMLSFPTNTSVP